MIKIKKYEKLAFPVWKFRKFEFRGRRRAGCFLTRLNLGSQFRIFEKNHAIFPKSMRKFPNFCENHPKWFRRPGLGPDYKGPRTEENIQPQSTDWVDPTWRSPRDRKKNSKTFFSSLGLRHVGSTPPVDWGCIFSSVRNPDINPIRPSILHEIRKSREKIRLDP